MKVTRIYTGPDDQSHFEDVEIPHISRAVNGKPWKSIFVTLD